MDLRHEITYAARVLLRSPGFTSVAVLALAAGIGANTAIFSIVNAVLFKPLPTPELERLVVIREDLPGLNLPDAELAPPEVLDLAERGDLFDAVTGFSTGERTLTGRGEPTQVAVAATLGDFTGVFGVVPRLGRFYAPDQSAGGPRDVVVVSYGLWRQLSGGDPAFIGSTITLDAIAHQVIGVLPREFREVIPRFTTSRRPPRRTACPACTAGSTSSVLSAMALDSARAWLEK